MTIGKQIKHAVSSLESLATFARYATVGIVQNSIFYALSLGLLSIGLKAWQALAILYPIAVTVSFLANRIWAFSKRPQARGQFRKYVILYASAYPLSILLTWLIEAMGVPSWLASLVTMFVAAAGLFLMLNKWVFAHDREQGPNGPIRGANPSAPHNSLAGATE